MSFEESFECDVLLMSKFDELLMSEFDELMVNYWIKMRRAGSKNRSVTNIIKDLFFNEINLLTEDINKETGLYMISLIAQLKDN